MDTPSVAAAPGQAPTSAGRTFSLKLPVGETGGSIMMLEQTMPAGTRSTFHLHRDSDEVAYVLDGEITVKIGDRLTSPAPAPAPLCHVECPMPGRSPARTPRACCFSIRREAPAG